MNMPDDWPTSPEELEELRREGEELMIQLDGKIDIEAGLADIYARAAAQGPVEWCPEDCHCGWPCGEFATREHSIHLCMAHN